MSDDPRPMLNPQKPSADGGELPSLRPNRHETALTASLFVAMLVSTFPEFTLGVLAPILVDELGAGEAGIGAAAATMYLGGAVVARTAGRRLDDVGGRTALTILYGAALGALALLAASRSLAWLIAVGLIGSVALGINNPITSRLIVASISPGRRGLAIGIKQTGVKVGQMLAGATIPWLSGTIGWRGGLLAFCGVASVVLFASLPIVPDGRQSAPAPRTTTVADARAQVRWLQFYAVAMAVGQTSITTYLALYAVQRLELSLTQGGMLVATFALTATIARILWVTAAERVAHPSSALILLSSGAVLGFILIVGAIPAGPSLVWVGAVVTGLTVGSWNTVVQLAVLTEVDSSRVGSATGAVQAAFMFGMAAGAPLFGLVVQLTGSFELAWALAVFMSSSAWVTAMAKRRDRSGPRPVS
jgi:predicted MFS family arabinose efflux permease